MTELPRTLEQIDPVIDHEKVTFINDISEKITHAGYQIAEIDDSRPWGGFIRIENEQGDEFVLDFFPGLSPEEARLGNPEAPLSPKILVVSPEQRLSLQTHERRAERWLFLTDGGYFKSQDPDNPGEMQQAKVGDVVQFAAGDVHRLCGNPEGYVLVAEIWQHTDPDDLSNEDDIARHADDYKR